MNRIPEQRQRSSQQCLGDSGNTLYQRMLPVRITMSACPPPSSPNDHLAHFTGTFSKTTISFSRLAFIDRFAPFNIFDILL